MKHRHVTTLLITITAASLLSACASAGLSGDALGPGSVAPDSGSPDSAAPDGSDPSTEDGVDSLADCLVGDWRLVNGSWKDLVNRQLAGEDGEVTAVDGELHVVFDDDGSYRVDYQDWVVKIAAEGGGFESTRRGVDAGIWTADDSIVSLTQQSKGSTLEAYIISGETRVSLPNGAGGSTLDFETFSALCAADELIATISSGDLIMLKD